MYRIQEHRYFPRITHDEGVFTETVGWWSTLFEAYAACSVVRSIVFSRKPEGVYVHYNALCVDLGRRR